MIGALSFRARGVLAYLAAHPDVPPVADVLVHHGREGRDAISTALGELRAAGAVRTERKQLADGTWRTDSTVTAEAFALIAPNPDSWGSASSGASPQVIGVSAGRAETGFPGRNLRSKDNYALEEPVVGETKDKGKVPRVANPVTDGTKEQSDGDGDELDAWTASVPPHLRTRPVAERRPTTSAERMAR